jgi:hypothetical protein
MLLSVELSRVGLVCLAVFGMAGCMAVTGKPDTSTSKPAVAELTVTPVSINFGNVAEGASAKETIDIVNNGTASAKITSLTMKGSGFTVTGIAVPLAIAGGESTSFTTEFTPASAGSATGSILLTSDIAGSTTITLVGTGSGATLAASPSSGNFGDVVVGNEATEQLQLKVSGNTSVKISKVSVTGKSFSIAGLSVPLTLNPGDTTSFSATFKPAAAQNESGEISIAADAVASPVKIDLAGEGVKPEPALSVMPSSLAFGNVGVGKAKTQQLTLKSTGNCAVQISSVATAGKGFSLPTGSSKATLAPGQQLDLTVTFEASKTGNASGIVTVTSNAANSPEKISLSGIGASTGQSNQTSQSNQTTQHVVTLNWERSSTVGVIGYYVYRGTQIGTYARISPSVTTTSYADSSAESGQNVVYYYVVTAVDSAGAESAFSNEVAVTIPNP